MNFISRTDSSGNQIDLFYEDLGKGQPIVFIHGWPLSHEMWEYQVVDLVPRGFRCITYDRRGFGKSSRPYYPYTYDELTADLKAVIDQLNLKDVILVGFSMGGGEAVRYLAQYGSERISKLILIGSVTPFLKRSDENPDGLDSEALNKMIESIRDDRIGFLDNFGKDFFGISFLNHKVSAPLLDWFRDLAAKASPFATVECAKAFAQTDFRNDLKMVKVPTLVIHGANDKTVPIDASSRKTTGMIPGSYFLIYDGAPHGLFYTHCHDLNNDIESFAQNKIPNERVAAEQPVF
jgi:non-heme chloroperoxidase